MVKKVIIAGGGIGGLFVALLLRRAGWQTINLEKRGKRKQTGSMLGLWPNATGILEEAGLLEELLQRGIRSRAMVLCSWRNEELNRMRVGESESASIQIGRGDLHEILWNALPGESVRLNSGVREFEESATGVRVETVDGQTLEADLLIGADGVHSRVRELIQGESPAVYRGYRAFYGRVESGGGEFTPGEVVYIGGRGKRAIVYPFPDGRVAWTVFLNGAQEDWKSQTTANEKLLAGVSDGPEALCRLVAAVPDPGQADICDRLPDKNWGRGPVTLLGDAAHATTPELAQGACMALEDGAVLVKLLAENNNPHRALRAYEAARFNRTGLVTLGSLVTGGFLISENPVLSSLRESATKYFPSELVSGVFQGIVGGFFDFKIK